MNNSLTVSNIITEKLKEFGVFGAEAIANNVVEHLNKAGYLLVENWLTHGQFDNMNNDTINLSLSDLDANLITFDSNLITFDETTSSGSLLNGNTDDIIVLDFNNMLPSDHFAGSHMNVTNIESNIELIETKQDSVKAFQKKLDKLKSDIEQLQEMSKRAVFLFELDAPEKV